MKGCRSITDLEIEGVLSTLKTLRDRALFVLGLRTGWRVSELLSLRIRDVIKNGKVFGTIEIPKRNTKGQSEGKISVLEDAAQIALKEYLDSIPGYDPEQPLFKSTRSDGAITRVQAHRILKRCFNELKMEGKLATHSMRKTFANRVHKALGSKIERTRVALCHKNLSSTTSYVEVHQEEVNKAILGMWK